MHPETPHIVLTTKSCIAVGAHFYSFATSRETFFAMVAEHFNGGFITNVEHPRAPLLYFKAVDALLDNFVCLYGKDCRKLPRDWDSTCFSFMQGVARLIISSGSLPEREDLLWAIMIVLYLPNLYPEVAADSAELAWQPSEEFKDDYKYASQRADDLWLWLCARVAEGGKSWSQQTKIIEDEAWRAIEYYQGPGSGEKVPKALRICFVCMANDHVHA